MATVSFVANNCTYTAHAPFTGTDPYPDGIPCPIYNVENLKDGGYITIYASEVDIDDGYGFPVYVYVNGVKYDDYLQSTYVSIPITGTTSVSLVPTKTATTYMLNVTCKGVSIGYEVSTNGATGTLSDGYSRNFDFGTTRGHITLTSVTPSSRYSHPVTGSSTTGTTSWTVTDSSGTITTAGKTVTAYSGGGVRYVTLSATLSATYYGRFQLNANGGNFYGTTSTVINWPTSGVLSNTGAGGAYVSTALPVSTGNFVPYRDGYTFVGWVIKQGETTPDYYSGETAGFTATSTSSSSPSTVTLYAVWMEDYSGSITVNSYAYDRNDKSFQGALGVTVTISPELGSWTLKASHTVTGTSVSKTIISSGSTTLVLPFLYISSNQTYTLTLTAPDGTVVDTIVVPCLDVPEYTLTFNANGGTGAPSALTTYGNVAKVTIPATIPTRIKYKFLGWAKGSLSTVLEVAVDDLPYEYSLTYDMTLYAVWGKKSDIDLFYWSSASTDDSLITTGSFVSNITAIRWNNLLAKIKELADMCDADFTYTPVSSGDVISATRFNVAQTGLSKIKTALNASNISLPVKQSNGNTIYATLFNGSTSLKGALNALIGVYNNE